MKKTIAFLQASPSLTFKRFARCFFPFPSSSTPATQANERLVLRSSKSYNVGGAVALWLVRPSPDRAVRVRALAGDIVLCSWARHFALTVPLSTQVYNWVPANLMLGDKPTMD